MRPCPSLWFLGPIGLISSFLDVDWNESLAQVWSEAPTQCVYVYVVVRVLCRLNLKVQLWEVWKDGCEWEGDDRLERLSLCADPPSCRPVHVSASTQTSVPSCNHVKHGSHMCTWCMSCCAEGKSHRSSVQTKLCPRLMIFLGKKKISLLLPGPFIRCLTFISCCQWMNKCQVMLVFRIYKIQWWLESSNLLIFPNSNERKCRWSFSASLNKKTNVVCS